MAMSGLLMAVSWWRHRLQCKIIASFLRLVNLFSGGGLSRCHGVRPWIKLTPEYPFNMLHYFTLPSLSILYMTLHYLTCCDLKFCHITLCYITLPCYAILRVNHVESCYVVLLCCYIRICFVCCPM